LGSAVVISGVPIRHAGQPAFEVLDLGGRDSVGHLFYPNRNHWLTDSFDHALPASAKVTDTFVESLSIDKPPRRDDQRLRVRRQFPANQARFGVSADDRVGI
jgi:hypothetical protein